MSRWRAIEHRLQTLATLNEAISALRALAASSFREARAELPAARAYAREVRGFLGVLEAPAAPGEGSGSATTQRGPAGLLLLTSDLGLVGDYASRVAAEAIALTREIGPGPIVCVGRRSLGALARAGLSADAVHPAPTTGRAMAHQLLDLADSLASMHTTRGIGSLWIVSARFQGAGHFEAAREQILPPAPEPGAQRVPVSRYSSPSHLRAVVLREYVAAMLYRSWLEALASEHGKRLVVAEGAHHWLSERIEQSRRQASSLRREASTQEVFEIVSASRARSRTGGASLRGSP